MSNSSIKKALLCASAAFVLLHANNAYANPQGADIIAGSATITSPSIDKLVVTQGTDKAIINWKSFDISESEWTQFIQPSSNSVALNRITNGKPTEILGKLSANGKLMVVNPNGVFFGNNSSVDVAGLVASTADTTNADFLAGKTNLSIAGKADASIVNKGSITAAEGGLVALVAPSVRNDGVIQANMGTVALASAQTASIDFYGDNLYSFALDKETTAAAQNEKSAVTNNGLISVGGGKVLLTAKVAKNVVDNVINNTGIIEANSAHMEGGDVVLDGGEGNVALSGKIDTSGTTGGNITVTGKNITLASADLDASGKNGGGKIKIGGDYQGKGSLAHAKTVNVDSSSKINVSATDSGNGGTAIVWSDELTDFNGSILGTGGINGGNGGFAEVSSKGELGYNGAADLHATNGEAGTLLLDPDSLFIGGFADHFIGTDHFVNFAPIVSTLNGGTNVTATALNNVSVLRNIVWTGSGSFSIAAGNNAIIEADIRASFAGSSTQGAVNINAGNKIQMGDATIRTANGDITTNSIDISMSNSQMISATGDVDINNSGKFSSDTANVLKGNSVSLNQSDAGSIQNAIDAVGATGSGGALLQLATGTWNEDFHINQGDFIIKGNGAANTIINAPFAFSHVISVSNNADKVIISDLAVNGGTYGVHVGNNKDFKLLNSLISNASTAGLFMEGSDRALIQGNEFFKNSTGIISKNTVSNSILNNELYRNYTAMQFTGDSWLRIKDNLFSGSATGVKLNNVVGSRIDDNTFQYTDTGIVAHNGNSIFISDNEMDGVYKGIDTNNTTGVSIVDNNISGYDYLTGDEGLFGIHVFGGLNTSIQGNEVSNFEKGIRVGGSNSTSILSNNIHDITKSAIYLNNDSHTLVFDNDIDSAKNGVHVTNSSRTDIIENNISNTLNGIKARNNSFLSIFDNNLHDNFIGINSKNSIFTKVAGNEIRDGFGGMIFDGDTFLIVDNNNLSNLFGGIGLEDVVGAEITNNNIEDTYYGIGAVGGNSLVVDNNTLNRVSYGITTEDTTGVTITNNNLFGFGFFSQEEGSGIGEYGIHVIGGLNTSIQSNNVDNFNMGIGVEDSVNNRVDFNIVTNTGDTGIYLYNNSNTLVIGNTVDTAARGIYALSAGSLLLDGNSVLNNLYGMVVENTDNVVLQNNIFTDNGTGAAFYNSDNASLTGDIFTGNVLGIDLDNSQNAFIREATMNVPTGGIGMFIHNASGGTLVRGLNITGGDIGVLIDGAGSSMQFASNTSSFTGQNFYFVLQNNAMSAGGSLAQADSLDASQQFFEGVRASDFTLAQRDAAEAKTIDVQDGIPTIGNVFYKDFFTSARLNGLDGLTEFEEYPVLGLFSYAGRTITNNPNETSPQYSVPTLSLSLLSSTGGSGASVQNPANLTPGQLGNLEPAAGGTPANLAALEPAAGGGEPNCGNNFLGSGFNNNFDMKTCAIVQQ